MASEIIREWPEDARKFVSEALMEKFLGSALLSPEAAIEARNDSGVRGISVAYTGKPDLGNPWIDPYGRYPPPHWEFLAIISGLPHAALYTYAEEGSEGRVTTYLKVYNPDLPYAGYSNYREYRSTLDIWA